jgi:hypothetical protein
MGLGVEKDKSMTEKCIIFSRLKLLSRKRLATRGTRRAKPCRCQRAV